MQTASPSLFVTMVISTWDMYISRFNAMLDAIPDEKLRTPVAPGRNSGLYILGHMVAVHDGMLPVLGFGERMHPELEPAFLAKPESSSADYPSIPLLKQYWAELNSTLSERFAAMSADQWFERHTAVTEDTFRQEPHRNKLNIVINRTNHVSYHMGQLVFLK